MGTERPLKKPRIPSLRIVCGASRGPLNSAAPVAMPWEAWADFDCVQRVSMACATPPAVPAVSVAIGLKPNTPIIRAAKDVPQAVDEVASAEVSFAGPLAPTERLGSSGR